MCVEDIACNISVVFLDTVYIYGGKSCVALVLALDETLLEWFTSGSTEMNYN